MMTNSIYIPKSYAVTNRNRVNRRNYRTYHLPSSQHEEDRDYSYSFSRNLPPNLDVFSELPSEVYNREQIRIFLADFKYVLEHSDALKEFPEIDLPKLHISEMSVESLQIDWIFSFFRFYFLFDRNEGVYFGNIENDNVNGRYGTNYKAVKKEDYRNLIKADLDYIMATYSQKYARGENG